MDCVLKVRCQDQLHRVLLANGDVTYEAVQQAIQKLYPGSACVATYLDEEDDTCTLCPASFSDFLICSGEQNGKKVLKLELSIQPNASTVAANTDSDSANVETSLKQLLEQLGQDSDLKSVDKALKLLLEQFAQCNSAGGWHSGPHEGHRLKKHLKFLLWQLHKNGALNASSAAALAVNFLPKLLSLAVTHGEKIDCKVRSKFPQLRQILEDLQALVASTPGLEESERSIAELLATEGSHGSKVVIQLLTALDVLPFEAQMDFFKALYVDHESLLQEKLAWADEHLPWMMPSPLEHQGITCDGCNQSPLKGLRFKCQTCADYDLCVDCFAKKGLIHSGECSAHEFDIVAPWGKGGCGKGKGKDWGKGMGKCWGKGMGNMAWLMRKGKGKGKGNGSSDGADTTQSDHKPRPCAREGCTFSATWHPTHCCGGCSHFSGHHGRCCQQIPYSDVAQETSNEVKGANRNSGETSCFDFSFPVVVEDGRSLTISWNRVDDPDQVAELFVQQHNIPHDEVETIKAFLEHAAAVSQGNTANDEHTMWSQPENEAQKDASEQPEAVLWEASQDRSHEGHHVMKHLKFMVWQLHVNGLLNVSSAAALAVNFLPKLITLVTARGGKVDKKVKKNFSHLMPVFQDIQALVASTPGLAQCGASVAALLAREGSGASEALLSLLTALHLVPFEAQIGFFQILYRKHEPLLQTKLAQMDEHMPWPSMSLPLAHDGVGCDGCNQYPLQGLRFKCKTCPDYDLCAECFSKKGLIHSGESSAHEFEVFTPLGKGGLGRGMGKGWGKGMGKFWGKGMGKSWGTDMCESKGKGKGSILRQMMANVVQMCKGKGKGKGNGSFDKHVSAQVDVKPRPCAREGCNFSATWHSTHCCGGCSKFPGHHGGRCQQIPFTDIAPAPSKDKESEDQDQTLQDSVAMPEAEKMNEDVGETDLKDAQRQLAEMGLGDGEVLLELLKSHGGSVQRVIEELTMEEQ